jgi:hypothetical protein
MDQLQKSKMMHQLRKSLSPWPHLASPINWGPQVEVVTNSCIKSIRDASLHKGIRGAKLPSLETSYISGGYQPFRPPLPLAKTETQPQDSSTHQFDRVFKSWTQFKPNVSRSERELGDCGIAWI